jgi:hypothetical protein
MRRCAAENPQFLIGARPWALAGAFIIVAPIIALFAGRLTKHHDPPGIARGDLPKRVEACEKKGNVYSLDSIIEGGSAATASVCRARRAHVHIAKARVPVFALAIASVSSTPDMPSHSWK